MMKRLLAIVLSLAAASSANAASPNGVTYVTPSVVGAVPAFTDTHGHVNKVTCNAHTFIGNNTGSPATAGCVQPGFGDLSGTPSPTQVTGGETAVTAASTLDLSAVTTVKVVVNGNTRINAITAPANALFLIRFFNAPTLTYDPNLLILPGRSDIVGQSGDTMIVSTDGSAHVRVREYIRAGQPVDYPTANVLANPSFDIWQENTTYTPTAAASPKIADRWRVFRLSSATNYTVSRVPGSTSTQYALLIQRTAGDTSTAQIRFGQQIFATTANTLAGNVYCISAVVQTGADWSAGTILPHISIGSGTDEVFNFTNGTFATGSSAVNGSAITISQGLPARLQLGCLTVVGAPSEAEVWFGTGTYTGTAGANDWIAFSDFQASLAGYSPYVHPTVQDSLQAALYTYRKTFTYATAPAQNVGTGTGEVTFPAGAAGANPERTYVFFDSPMRGVPSITFYNPAAANGNARDETASADCTSPTASNITEKGFSFVCTGNASTALNNIIGFHYTADARL